MLKWDGSDISDFLDRKEVYWEEGIYEKSIIWRIYYKNSSSKTQEEICYVRACSTYLPCIIDEFKTMFHIEKIGTHYTKYKGKCLILLKPNIQNGKIIQEISLDQVEVKDKLFIEEVRKIFLFRELIGITRSTEKSIICRVINGVKPISFYEPNMKPNKNGKILSNKNLNKWFNGSLDNYLIKFLKIKDKHCITKVIFNLRIEMEKIVNRIDKKAIGYIDQILSRIQSRLQHILV